MADYTPVYDGGADPLTLTTSAAVTGGQCLIVTGSGTVGPSAGASAVAIGIAAFDAASGAKVTVWPINNAIHEMVAAAGITAGDGITSAASGQVTTAVVGTAAAAGTLIGIALTTATSGNKVRFMGRN